jgi:hypothetical protein
MEKNVTPDREGFEAAVDDTLENYKYWVDHHDWGDSGSSLEMSHSEAIAAITKAHNAAVTQAVRTELESLREDHTLIPQQNIAFERQQDWSNGWSHSWQHQMNRIDHALAEYRTQEDDK